jgi:hypothetical protein
MIVFVKPKDGLIVRDPKTKVPIPVDGMNIALSGKDGTYWRRRIKEGSLIVSPNKKDEKRKDGIK